ncbi:MAG: delta-1-pyrroline-5-carboxylate dehydrogenase, partial [Rickettsiales bacterium]|nr:delta-1-pyrroline-5-carboxylate dehydrogenase [Rickettsiales bacterium]
PVFTRKSHTDVNYLACASKLLETPSLFYPQFATHNALTVASIIELAGDTPFEFQRLYGMGQKLYDQIVKDYPVRVYAPVGRHKDLLAYLIRRLLENGANTSFVNLLMDRDRSLDELLRNPIVRARKSRGKMSKKIPLPIDLYGDDRHNSRGVEFGYAYQSKRLLEETKPFLDRGLERPKDNTVEEADKAMQMAGEAFAKWDAASIDQRAACLDRAAELLEERRDHLLALCVLEGKKTYSDGIAEVREAADFCRYYAARAREMFPPSTLTGPTGESNTLSLSGRGVYVCISPWNFPLAIFVGQVVAALVAGNTVVAKPAEQTPAIAEAAVKLLYEAGVPEDVLHLVFGDGESIGAHLVSHPKTAGVAFTGSTGAAKAIQRAQAASDGPIIPLIAETGGQNCMMIDSSALLEQATDDIILSAFGSAGQRCSALRVLYVQEDIADSLIKMIKGAMDELTIGWAGDLSTDVGPVIDKEAQGNLQKHIERLKKEAKDWYSATVSDKVRLSDTFVVPHMFEISDIDEMGGEHFGPILHIIRYSGKKRNEVIDRINGTGYGLTFGLQSRVQQQQEAILPRIHAGNMYVNRNMTGAVVGVQPFGGEGLSGTGPKAGGPYYLLRFAAERTLTINTAAIGGNIELLS